MKIYKDLAIVGVVVVILLLLKSLFFLALDYEEKQKEWVGRQFNRSEKLISKGDYKGAVRELKWIPVINKDWTSNVYFKIGKVYYVHGEYKKALEYLKKARNKYIENYDPRINFYKSYIEKNEKEKEILYYETIKLFNKLDNLKILDKLSNRQQEPYDYIPYALHYFLGCAYMDSGENEKALEEFRMMRRLIKPNHPEKFYKNGNMVKASKTPQDYDELHTIHIYYSDYFYYTDSQKKMLEILEKKKNNK